MHRKNQLDFKCITIKGITLWFQGVPKKKKLHSTGNKKIERQSLLTWVWILLFKLYYCNFVACKPTRTYQRKIA